MSDNEVPLYQEIEDNPYAKVTLTGEQRQPFHVKGVWHFEIASFMKPVDPINYFKTTGEAIQKMTKLEADLQKQLATARKVRAVLEKLRGGNAYLETQWNNSRLLLKIKNPRKARPEADLEESVGPVE